MPKSRSARARRGEAPETSAPHSAEAAKSVAVFFTAISM